MSERNDYTKEPPSKPGRDMPVSRFPFRLYRFHVKVDGDLRYGGIVNAANKKEAREKIIMQSKKELPGETITVSLRYMSSDEFNKREEQRTGVKNILSHVEYGKEMEPDDPNSPFWKDAFKKIKKYRDEQDQKEYEKDPQRYRDDREYLREEERERKKKLKELGLEDD